MSILEDRGWQDSDELRECDSLCLSMWIGRTWRRCLTCTICGIQCGEVVSVCDHSAFFDAQKEGTRMAIKVFSGNSDFKSLKREIDVVRSLPHHENIVRLENVEEDVSTLA